MFPWLLAALLMQQPPPPAPPSQPPPAPKKPEIVILDPNAPKGLEEPEEAEPKEYSYNPFQAEKEVEVGNFYMKKGNYPAAIKRYQEATKWKPNWGLAYLKLGQAYEKKGEPRRAAEAYRKYLEILPKDRRAAQLRKEIARLEREAAP